MRVIEKVETPEPLNSRFKELNIEVITYAHEAVFTVDEGKDIKAQLVGGHTKNLFLKDKKEKVWLIIALAETKIALNQVHKEIGSARLSFGKADLMKEILGVTPGSVTPFSLINDKENHVNLILDKAMLSYKILNYHPLKNDKTTAISPDNLLKFIKSCGHEPMILDFKNI